MRVIQSSTGIGRCYVDQDIIEYNKELSPSLLFRVLSHEYGHLGKSILQNVWWDVKALLDFRFQTELLLFNIKHPSSLINWPIEYKYHDLQVDPFQLSLILLLLVVVII